MTLPRRAAGARSRSPRRWRPTADPARGAAGTGSSPDGKNRTAAAAAPGLAAAARPSPARPDTPSGTRPTPSAARTAPTAAASARPRRRPPCASAAWAASWSERCRLVRSRTGERLRRRWLSGRSGFALEIDHQEILADRHQMPEVVVAVTADAHRRDHDPGCAGPGAAAVSSPRSTPVGRFAQRLRQSCQSPAAAVPASAGFGRASTGSSDRWYIGVNGSGAKAGSSASGGQGDVQLGRPPGHQPGRLQVRAKHLPRLLRDLLLAQVHDRTRPRFQLRRRQVRPSDTRSKKRCRASSVSRQASPSPAMYSCGRCPTSSARRVSGWYSSTPSRAGVCVKAPVVAKAPQHFHFGMSPLLDAAVELEQQAAAVEHGGRVAQLREGAGAASGAVSAARALSAAGSPRRSPASPSSAPPFRRRVDQGAHEIAIRGRVVQDAMHALRRRCGVRTVSRATAGPAGAVRRRRPAARRTIPGRPRRSRPAPGRCDPPRPCAGP